MSDNRRPKESPGAKRQSTVAPLAREALASSPRGSVWSEAEVEAVVSDYLNMLRAEMEGHPYSKAQHRRALLERLDGRTAGAVELKHQNISAVMQELGLPRIAGYVPRGNYQRMLAEVVGHRLEVDPALCEAIGRFADTEPPVVRVVDLLDREVSPPEPRDSGHGELSTELADKIGARIDYAGREERNRRLGIAGEEFVVRFEMERLRAGGAPKLADGVEHVAVSEGDGLGYDVRSFEIDGRERLIEVKTTKGPIGTPFYVSRNEVLTSVHRAERYCLYRVFAYASDPRLYVLRGALSQVVELRPVNYVARVV